VTALLLGGQKARVTEFREMAAGGLNRHAGRAREFADGERAAVEERVSMLARAGSPSSAAMAQ